MRKRIISLITALAMFVTMFSSGMSLFTVPAFADETGSQIKAGAGSSAIAFPESMFPIEGFDGSVESDPYVRVLLIEDGTSAAIVSGELVNIPEDVIGAVKTLINEKAGVPEENVWVHANHTITTMHSRGDAAEAYYDSVMAAAEIAVNEAVESFQPAVMGVGVGTLDINTNRNYLFEGKYYIGDECETTLEGSNKKLTIVRFDSLEGDPIGMAISYGMKPTTIDNAEQSENTRKISSDLTGLACVKMEEEFECPVMFVMPASGDQEAKKTTNTLEWGVNPRTQEEGWQQAYKSVEYGIGLVREYGQTMYETCSALAKTIECTATSAPVQLKSTAAEVTLVDRGTETPGTLDVSALSIGDSLAFVGLKPEVDALTEAQLWEDSPFENTLLVSFMNGDSKYMPHSEAYDIGTVEAGKSGFKQGTAETFVSTAVELLDSMIPSNGIAGVMTYGFVDLEGAKTKAIIVEYEGEVDAASVDPDTYEITDYTTYNVAKNGRAKTIELDYDDIENNEGQIEKVYVNDAPEIAEEGKEAGKYVVIEVNTDYMLSSQNLVYTESMMGGVKQVKDIAAADGSVIPASDEEIGNYEVTETEMVTPSGQIRKQTKITSDKDSIILPEFAEGSGWTLNYIGDGAFQATDCYSEYTGEYCDFELPYSIYVPDEEILEANKGKIALAIHMEHAGANDTDPMAAITSSKAAVKLAAKAKEEGNYAIVVVPQVEESRRSTDDYDASSEVNTAVWELLDWLINEKYAGYIDTTRIYGSGQSMGIMTILYMGAQRDNFFAGAAVTGGQWSNNYDKPYQHNGAPIRTPEVDPISFGIKDGQGYEHSEEWYTENHQNWYYMISDDNLFIHTCLGDGMAWGEWNDTAQYFAAAGKEIPYQEYSPYAPLDEQNALDRALDENNDSGLGIIWSTFTEGNHMSTWKYGWALDYIFDWLFAQSNETAKARGKIEQLNNEWLGRDEDGNIREGSGTKNLNSAQYTPRGADPVYTEGWKPDYSLKGIRTIGFVDADGAKINAVAIEYSEPITAASVDASDFEVSTYDVRENSKVELGSDPGAVLRVYVNDKAEIADEGKESGKYVIVEVNTDYQRSSVPAYTSAMTADVKQIGEVVTTTGAAIAATEDVYSNYTVDEVETVNPQGQVRIKKVYVLEEGTYEITNIADFQLFTIEDGTAFHATNCQEEALDAEGAEQKVIDVDVPYALYVPAGYAENPDGNWGLALQIEDAGALGTDPMIALTESQACANFASAEVQQMAKDAGMDGLFVITPQCSEELRSTRDNYTISAFVPATWQLLDYITEEYNINMNRIFATGQSMGGMQVIAMAAQRDNYFAGIWENGCQWGANWNKEEPYPERGGKFGYYTMSTDPTIWTKDDDGNDSEYGQNWYYLISDDNLMISNCQGDLFSTTVWKELKYLYLDIANAEIPYVAFNPLTETLDAQNAAIDGMVAAAEPGKAENFGFTWYAYNGGSHMLTWVYGHKLDAPYRWLVSQKREAEQEREKIGQLANDWARETDAAKIAAKQTEDRNIGGDNYFAVPAEGAGTRGYNAGWFGMQGTLADDVHVPGWPVEEQTLIDISDAVVTFNGLEVTKAGQYWAAYDGAEKKPGVIVTLGGQTLTADDYDVAYADNKKVGTATVTVTGKGSYTGSAVGTFMITFKDVPATHNYQKAVYWAVGEGIAAGYSGTRTGTFGVSDDITRGQVVMFLWRAAGSPDPKNTTSATFKDVPVSHNFFKAIQWASENKIAAGYTGTKKGYFGPSDKCTRGQIVTFLWRYAGSPAPVNTTEQKFTDVPVTHNFYKQIQWAYENGITAGYKDGSFGVTKSCTRGQCVTFLYRLLAE